jgi:hypothetical protein
MGNITLIDPVVRLKILSKYMSFWITNYPTCVWSFETYIRNRYSHLIPGTIEHAKCIATHCYYCNRMFSTEKTFRASVDHYLPQSLGITDRYVICCVDCNNRKADTPPSVLVSQFTNAYLKGKQLWGYHGKKLRFISNQIQTITNDMLYNRGPKIYYFKR